MSETRGDEYVFHSIMFNRLSDRYPCRTQKHTPLARLSSTLSPLAGRLVGRMQYAPTLSEKDKVSSGWCFPSSRTMVDKYVFNFFMSNRLSDRYPGRGVLHTPLNHSRKGYSIARQTIVGRMQYAPTFPEKDKVSSGRYFPLSRTVRDQYVFHFFMSNRLSDRYPCRAQKHTPLARLSSTPTPFAGRLVRRMQYAPTLSEKEEVSSGWCYLSSQTRRDQYVFHFSMSNRLSDGYPCRGVLNTPLARLLSTLSSLTGRLMRRKQYAPTLPEKEEVSSGRCYLLSQTMADKSVFHSSMSNRLSDRHPCRGVLHTPFARLSSTPSPLAGRLVRRRQYAPTLPEKDEVSLGRYVLLSRTMRDQYAFHFFMSNRLSDRYPGRAQKHKPLARLSSTLSSIMRRLVGRMLLRPNPAGRKIGFEGLVWGYVWDNGR